MRERSMETAQRIPLGLSIRAWGCFLLAVAMGFAWCPGPSWADEYEAGFVQVQLNPGHTISEVNAIYGTVAVDSLPPSYLLVVPAGLPDDSLLAEMEGDPDGTFACVEHSWRNETPEGTRQMVVAAVGGTITGYLDQGLVQRLHLAEIQAHTRGDGIVVAVLDTGVKADHEALGNAVRADGYDFIDNDGDPSDLADGIDEDGDGSMDEGAGHGTMVAGIVHLVAPGARILPIRVLDDEGHGTTFTVAKGIRYAVEHGADVINMSLGLTTRSGIIAHELSQARLAATAMVAAAGNLGVDSVQVYPASDSKVLMVAGLDSADVKAPFSSYHSKVAVSAPGLGIYAPYYDGAYAIGAGTSFAAPFVSGVCALIAALEPGLDWDGLYDRVTQGVVDIYGIPGNEPYMGKLGSGRIDGVGLLQSSPALTAVDSLAPFRGLDLAPNPAPAGSPVHLAWSGLPPGGSVEMSLFDATGRRVRRLASGLSGPSSLHFEARDDAGRPLSAGAYFLRVAAPGVHLESRMVIVR